MSTIKTTNLQNASAANPAFVLAADGSATANLSSLNGGPIAGSRNRIINGDMRIDQRNAGASVAITTAGNYTVDRWSGNATQNSKCTVQQNSGSVNPPSGFTNYLGAVSSSAYSVVSSDIFWLAQALEGLNVADLGWGAAGAQSVTLSFWVRSSLTGTFGGALRNSAGTRSYPFAYTISAGNTWEQKSIVITGDTSGTWLSTNGIGINLNFGLGVGSTYSGTAGTWAAANYVSATGATSVVGTNGATFYITGVQLEPGSVATPFERRSYGAELALCQRYYQQNGGVSGVPWALAVISGGGGSTAAVVFGTLMRTSPTLNVVGTGFDAADNSLGPVTATVSLNTASNYVCYLTYTHSSLTNNAARRLTTTNTTSFLQFSAEL